MFPVSAMHRRKIDALEEYISFKTTTRGESFLRFANCSLRRIHAHKKGIYFMIIEKATSLDLEGICQIDSSVIGNDSRKEYLSESIEKETCIIARMDGKPVGFTVFDTSFYDNCFIWLLIVLPQFRRKGAASGLIQYVEKNCPTSKLFTSTNESNVTMQKVCESLGFVRSGVIENLDEGDPEWVYFKPIS